MIYFDKGDKSLKGQLDLFFPKEKYPYLALSIYNLVPSCSYCNGRSCKSNIDPYEKGLISPFSITDHKGLRFRLKNFDSDIFDLEKCADKIDIGVDTTKNPSMAINSDIFHLRDVYLAHRDLAAEIIFKYRALSSSVFLNAVRDTLQSSDLHISMRDISLLFWGVPLSEDRLGDRPMSKFTLDLIDQLSDIKP